MSSNLREACIDLVARELSRPGPRELWTQRWREKRPEAEEKINAMSNLELLDILNEAFHYGFE